MTETNLAYTTMAGENIRLDFETVYSRYAAALYGILLKMVNDSAVAEDLLQDVFVKVWKSSGKYNETRGTLFTWLLNIARNTGIDYLRSRSYKQTLNTIAVPADHSGVVEDNQETNREAKQLINTLDDKHRDVLDLLFIKGHTQQEAATILNLPLGTVKTRARNAVLLLRKQNNL
jgi:RNA polymerase sigma-70 factor, ECF subfamily